MLVEELLHSSPLRLITAGPQTPVSEAAQRMAQNNIGLVVVMDDDQVAGVFSERDLVKGFGAAEIVIEEAVVGDLMTKLIITVSPTDSLVDATIAMNANNIRHLVVVQAGRPVGVVSIRDVLRVFAEQLLAVKDDAGGELELDLVKALAVA
ncbi:MAG: CBS domain-containing protein [Rhodospirillaceae bacterium]|jgi:CBS domain-containing protein|nr:CBS domain-containing protein [Rhodospirillaceae bacterium]MBT5458550.1 CBS domain-containing protein [Rhodospirillaceae bacterium]